MNQVKRSQTKGIVNSLSTLLGDRKSAAEDSSWTWQYREVVWSGLQLSGDAPHRLGTPHRAQIDTVEAITKYNYITYRQQTYLYLGLTYTENTGQST